MLAKSVLGLRLTKEALNINIDAPSLESAIELENRTQNVCSQSKDTMEASRAFFEKREPKFDRWWNLNLLIGGNNLEKRISKNEYFMRMAKVASLRSTCIKRKVGAVLVKDDHILSTG